jgi:hypothetical protein
MPPMADMPDSNAPASPQPLNYAPASTPVVTLRSFYSALDAQIHANALAEAGIVYNLLGGNTNSLGPYNAFTQVDLQVDERDREAAENALKQLEATAGSGEIDEEHADELNELNEPRCPQCQSWRTYEVPAPWPGLMNFLLGRLPEQPRQLECLKCHYRWIAGARDEVKAE